MKSTYKAWHRALRRSARLDSALERIRYRGAVRMELVAAVGVKTSEAAYEAACQAVPYTDRIATTRRGHA